MALHLGAWIALRPRARRRRVVLRSLDFGEEQEFDLGRLHRGQGWIEYVKGTAWAFQEAGAALRGWDGVVTGDVPIGAGLSSSAALEVAAARAFAAAADLPWQPVTAARLAQRAENGWVGVQCGIMDQLVVAAGREGHALLIDCRDLTTRPIPLPAGDGGGRARHLDAARPRGLHLQRAPRALRRSDPPLRCPQPARPQPGRARAARGCAVGRSSPPGPARRDRKREDARRRGGDDERGCGGARCPDGRRPPEPSRRLPRVQPRPGRDRGRGPGARRDAAGRA